ncbi:MAG: hypothetical protein QMB24_12910 [Spirosomataceae bacterium]
MNRLITFSFLFAVAFSQWACQPTAQSIIDDSIVSHGGEVYNSLNVEFDFRAKHYVIKTNGDKYQYERHQTDSSGVKTVDVLTNDSFVRKVNGEEVSVPDSMVVKYSSSINSVAYFFLLPAPLNDAAVKKKLLADINIKGQAYHQVEVTFAQESGGEDFQDRYIYWIHTKNKTVDYLAYSYEVSGSGVRFREAYNVQTKNGLRFCDYRNYGFEDTRPSLEKLPALFEAGSLPLLSSIENENVVVK